MLPSVDVSRNSDYERRDYPNEHFIFDDPQTPSGSYETDDIRRVTPEPLEPCYNPYDTDFGQVLLEARQQLALSSARRYAIHMSLILALLSELTIGRHIGKYNRKSWYEDDPLDYYAMPAVSDISDNEHGAGFEDGEEVREDVHESFRQEILATQRRCFREIQLEVLRETHRERLRKSLRDSLEASLRASFRNCLETFLQESLQQNFEESIRTHVQESNHEHFQENYRRYLRVRSQKSLDQAFMATTQVRCPSSSGYLLCTTARG